MGTLFQRDGEVPQSKTIVFLGDSNTDNGTYIALMNAYFMQHMPEQNLNFINLGVNSETVAGLSEDEHPWPRPCLHDRLERALEESRPDWVVLCYGMNDGIYHPFGEERFRAYREGLRKAIRRCKQTADKVIVMTPPPYDHFTKSQHPDFGLPGEKGEYSWKTPYAGYSEEVLRRYADWIMSLGGEVDETIDIYEPLRKDLASIRLEQPDYMIGDGIHPNARGHWVIARTVMGRLFNISLTRMPDYVTDSEANRWFPLVMRRHRLLSSAWKEHVGHTNPNKADAMPLDEARAEAKRLAEKIAVLIGESREDALACLSVSDWNGYSRTDGYMAGREVIVIEPKEAAPGRPWVWRAEFFDDFAYADRALLERGWHIAYCRLSHMYGCPGAVRLMAAFQTAVTAKFALAEKPALFGFSRGGLYAVGYAAAYPQRVGALYLDAPVLDVLSWPAGKGAGSGSPANWEDCKAVYGLDEQTAPLFRGSPVHRAAELARSGVPVLIVAGDADVPVPYEENGVPFERLYKEAGGTIESIVKPGVGHHPHSLEHPEPIVRFVEKHASARNG